MSKNAPDFGVVVGPAAALEELAAAIRRRKEMLQDSQGAKPLERAAAPSSAPSGAAAPTGGTTSFSSPVGAAPGRAAATTRPIVGVVSALEQLATEIREKKNRRTSLVCASLEDLANRIRSGQHVFEHSGEESEGSGPPADGEDLSRVASTLDNLTAKLRSGEAVSSETVAQTFVVSPRML